MTILDVELLQQTGSQLAVPRYIWRSVWPAGRPIAGVKQVHIAIQLVRQGCPGGRQTPVQFGRLIVGVNRIYRNHYRWLGPPWLALDQQQRTGAITQQLPVLMGQ